MGEFVEESEKEEIVFSIVTALRDGPFYDVFCIKISKRNLTAIMDDDMDGGLIVLDGDDEEEIMDSTESTTTETKKADGGVDKSNGDEEKPGVESKKPDEEVQSEKPKDEPPPTRQSARRGRGRASVASRATPVRASRSRAVKSST